MTFSVVGLEPTERPRFLDLMREVYGTAMSQSELDWYVDGNPTRPAIVSVAEEDGAVIGVSAMALAEALVDGQEVVVAFAVHAATHPAAQGKGVFSRLELHNERLAAEAGAALALGFTNPLAGPILVGRLGWRDLYRMRVWARPVRPWRARRRTARPGLPASRGPRLARFAEAHERAWRGVQHRWGASLVRSGAYLNWRYIEAPRDYRAFASNDGYAVVGHAMRDGLSAAVVCDLVGPPSAQRPLVRRCVEETDGQVDAIVAVPAPDQRAAYVSLGFLPTRRTIRVIGKPLSPEAELPARWHFSLGDTDLV